MINITYATEVHMGYEIAVIVDYTVAFDNNLTLIPLNIYNVHFRHKLHLSNSIEQKY